MPRTGPPSHRGYVGSCIMSSETGVFFGHVTNVREVLIPFRFVNLRDFKPALRAAVDAYLRDCRFAELPPEKPVRPKPRPPLEPRLGSPRATAAIRKPQRGTSAARS